MGLGPLHAVSLAEVLPELQDLLKVPIMDSNDSIQKYFRKYDTRKNK